jgi:hypothetical protein
MRADTVVIFSPEHYDWLVRAERWPSLHVSRESHRGRVVASGEGWARVLWNGRIEPSTHFTSNLEEYLP